MDCRYIGCRHVPSTTSKHYHQCTDKLPKNALISVMALLRESAMMILMASMKTDSAGFWAWGAAVHVSETGSSTEESWVIWHGWDETELQKIFKPVNSKISQIFLALGWDTVWQVMPRCHQPIFAEVPEDNYIIIWLNMGIILYCNHNVIVSYYTVIMVLRIQLEAYCNCIILK